MPKNSILSPSSLSFVVTTYFCEKSEKKKEFKRQKSEFENPLKNPRSPREIACPLGGKVVISWVKSA
jgi:hypothetical protein